ncbi:MAG: ABC transporter permease [Gemmataceae bacterium]
MKWRTLLHRNLRYHLRGNFAVMLGVAVGTAALVGALLVGDSLHGSLRSRALRRLGSVEQILISPQPISEETCDKLENRFDLLAVSVATGSIAALDAHNQPQHSVSGVSVICDRPNHDLAWFIEPSHNASWFALPGISSQLATDLNASLGDRLRLRVTIPGAVPRDSTLGRKTGSELFKEFIFPAQFRNDAVYKPWNEFNLTPGFDRPHTVFYRGNGEERPLPLNALLTRSPIPTDADLRSLLDLPDYGLRIQRRASYISIESRSLVLQAPAIESVRAAAASMKLAAEPTMVYLANSISDGTHEIPYSVVAALNPQVRAPLGPFISPSEPSLADDEILLADWAESPLTAKTGDKITLRYFLPESEGKATEATATFKLRAKIPMTGPTADPNLTPEFPGITDKLTLADWDPPFPYDPKKITKRDEDYWHRYRGTPKAYFNEAVGKKLFGSRFGEATSVRIAPSSPEKIDADAAAFEAALKQHLKPADFGLVFRDVRAQALHAAEGSVNFSGLFSGFSLFLIAAALLLVALLVRLNLDHRASEVGLWLALGFSHRAVRRLLLAEGLFLSVLGAVIGLLMAIGYAALMLRLLGAMWPEGQIGSFLELYITGRSLGIGFIAATIVSALTIALALRALSRVPAPLLLRGVSSCSVPEFSGAFSVPSSSPPQPTSPLPTSSGPLPPCGGGLGWGVEPSHASTPHPSPPPQGGRGPEAGAREKGEERREADGRGSGADGGRQSRKKWWLVGAIALGLVAIAALVAGPFLHDPESRAGSFFTGGAALLALGLLLMRQKLRSNEATSTPDLTIIQLGIRNASRYPTRSLLTAGLLASAAFLLVAVESFRRTPGADFAEYRGGSGGYQWIASFDLQLYQDPEDPATGRQEILDSLEKHYQKDPDTKTIRLAAAADLLKRCRLIALRSKTGDEAGCRNLYKPTSPRIYGVPFRFIDQGGFHFVSTLATTVDGEANPWRLLAKSKGDIPVFGEANTVQWMLGKSLGDTIEITDEREQPVKLRIAGLLQDSIFQGELVMAEPRLLELYPNLQGFSVLLARTPVGREDELRNILEIAYADRGIALERTADRLQSYLAIENTYLSTFQILGGFGLLLGACGLGVVLMRSAWERRGELALLQAVGFRRDAIARMVLSENFALLGAGLGIGIVAALATVLPQRFVGEPTSIPVGRLAGLLAAVLVTGVVAGLLALRPTLRAPIVSALRGE